MEWLKSLVRKFCPCLIDGHDFGEPEGFAHFPNSSRFELRFKIKCKNCHFEIILPESQTRELLTKQIQKNLRLTLRK